MQAKAKGVHCFAAETTLSTANHGAVILQGEGGIVQLAAREPLAETFRESHALAQKTSAWIARTVDGWLAGAGFGWESHRGGSGKSWWAALKDRVPELQVLSSKQLSGIWCKPSPRAEPLAIEPHAAALPAQAVLGEKLKPAFLSCMPAAGSRLHPFLAAASVPVDSATGLHAK